MLITKSLLRGGVPLIIMGGIAIMLYALGKYSDAKGTFIAGLIAFFVGAASVIYNINHWSLPKQVSIHFLIMLLTVYPILLWSGWFTISTPLDAFKIFLLFILVGIILGTTMFVIMKTIAR